VSRAAGAVGSAALKALRAYGRMQKNNIGGHHVKAFLSNGLEELRQAVAPSFSTQIGAGPVPAYGVPTQGQLTNRREPKKDRQMDLEG
jgi:hypothetical protein